MDVGEAAVAGGIVGVVCGLIPFITGLVRGDTTLAIGGLVACILGGVVLGLLLAVPLAILFTVLIVRRTKKGGELGADRQPGVDGANA